jgi:hypothetical protein
VQYSTAPGFFFSSSSRLVSMPNNTTTTTTTTTTIHDDDPRRRSWQILFPRQDKARHRKRRVGGPWQYSTVGIKSRACCCAVLRSTTVWTVLDVNIVVQIATLLTQRAQNQTHSHTRQTQTKPTRHKVQYCTYIPSTVLYCSALSYSGLHNGTNVPGILRKR